MSVVLNRSCELVVQAELRTHGLDALLNTYKLACKRHSQYNNLVMLKYSSNDFRSDVMRECRGIVLDEAHDWAVVGMPFYKFMNHGEKGADPIEWSRARVYEKLDGSICMLYFYNNRWCVATSGSPDASGSVGKQTFAKLFWDIWHRVCRYREPLDTQFTYIFELLSPQNQILCRISSERIVLLGVRRLADLQELSPEEHALQNGWEVARSFPLTSLDDVLQAAATLNTGGVGLQDGRPADEGFVVCDMCNFNRVKVKSPTYVALAHLRGGSISGARLDKHLLPLVLADEVEEMSAYFPHLRPRLEHLKEAVSQITIQAAQTRLQGMPCVGSSANVDPSVLLELLSQNGLLSPSSETPPKAIATNAAKLPTSNGVQTASHAAKQSTAKARRRRNRPRC